MATLTRLWMVMAIIATAVGACAEPLASDDSLEATEPDAGDVAKKPPGGGGLPPTPPSVTSAERTQIANRIRALMPSRNITPITTPTIPGTEARKAALVALGQALVFDKILSDNRDVSCMTCHPPAVGGDDDRTLSMGVRGLGLGPSRAGGIDIPRHSPAIFNLHMMDSLFWDGRVEKLPDGTLRTPAGAQLTPQMRAVFEFGALSALAMFPVENRKEMRELTPDGTFDDLSSFPDGDFTGVWNAIMVRLRAIPKYREMFGDAYPSWPGTRTNRIDTMTFAHASNAIGAFLATRFVSKDSPWDNFVAGDDKAFQIIEEITRESGPLITEKSALLGAERFLQTCANCHNGPLLTDGRFHNTALAQLGPGVGDGELGNDDFGRARVVADTDATARCGNAGTNASCRYAFRTTPLRNVALTAPYGHAGEFGRVGNDPDFGTDIKADIVDLREFVAHYAVNPADNLRAYSPAGIDPRFLSTVVDNTDAIIADIDPLFTNGSPVGLADVDNITAFMVAQTSMSLLGAGAESGTSARFALCGVIPLSVPSGASLDVDFYDEDDCKADGKHNDDF